MAETRKKPAKKPATKADPETVRQALDELGIDRPFYNCRVVGNRLEFSLYGGDVVFWPPKRARKRTPKED